MKIFFTIIWIIIWAVWASIFWDAIDDKLFLWVSEIILAVVFILGWVVITTASDDEGGGGSSDNLLLTTTTLLVVTTIL